MILFLKFIFQLIVVIVVGIPIMVLLLLYSFLLWDKHTVDVFWDFIRPLTTDE